MKRYLLIILLYCLSYQSAFAAIHTQVNPATVNLGETFRLTFMMEDAQSSGLPDLTVLKRDFIIMGTERSMVYTIINGQARSVDQWSVLLKPKKTGVIPIPAIEIGQQQSSATSVEVTNEASITANVNDPMVTPDNEVMLKTDVSVAQPFINQQVIYTVKLYTYNNRRLLDAEYQPPKIEDALLIPLGEGRRYPVTENGRSYNVEEQQYAIFPQKSGNLQITPPSFNALLYDAVPRQVNLRGDPTKLTVKPMPASYGAGHWLPAKQVVLTEQYDKNQTTMLQGTTLVRTVTLQVTAMPAQLLPSLTFATSKQFNSYLEKPEISNKMQQQELIGTTTVKVTYLLNQAGQITIPTLQVPWFNTVTDKKEVATLPARIFKVDPRLGTSPVVANTPAAAEQMPVTDGSVEQTVSKSVKESSLSWWLAIGFALAWVLTLGLWWCHSSLFSNNTTRAALNSLKEACLHNNPVQTQSALLNWANVQWPHANLLNLNDIARMMSNAELKKQIYLLTQALYSQHKKIEWRGEGLWQSMSTSRPDTLTKKNKTSDLPPINPA